MDIVVVVNSYNDIRTIPKAKVCCLVCFQEETPQKFFLNEELLCGCKPNIHIDCIPEWFRIARQEVCANCGEKWEEYYSCCQKFLFVACVLCSFIGVGTMLGYYIQILVSR